MADQEKSEKTLLINRRQVLKLAGFAITRAALLASAPNPALPSALGDKEQAPWGASPFPHLFSPLKIGTFTVRNRILSTAHFTGFAEKGMPSDRHRAYWGSKAKGGIGLIITEVQPVHPTAGIGPSMIQCYRDGVAKAFRPIVEEVHRYGGRIMAQIWHPGKSTLPYSVQEVVSSSPIPSPSYGTRPRALTVKEIQELVESYARSAARMREGGLDGVEIHCAHGYLPLQFMSPLHNQRTDGYGGPEENRIRFPLEIIRAVRKAVGDDYTVGIRITGDELVPGGLTLADMKRITPKLVAAGNLDYVNVSLGGPNVIAPMGTPHGAYVYLAEGIQETVAVPVFCIGRIVDPAMAEEIVKTRRAHMVGMTRANMADPDLPVKARQGRVEDIRPCIGLMTCWARTAHPEGITCALNPSVGKEERYKITPAPHKKRILVVGGGAAGMEAARVAAERGHAVTLIEKEPYLGGQMVLAAQTVNRAEMRKPIIYYQGQLKKLGVIVRLGTTVTRELIEKEDPDEVIVATGGLPKGMVVSGAAAGQVVQGREVLMGRMQIGKKVVVVAAEAGMEGLSTAEFLADSGKKVEVFVPQYKAGQEVENVTRLHLLYRLSQKGVVVNTRTRIEALQGRKVIASKADSPYTVDEVDHVILCLGSIPNNELLRALAGFKKKIHAVGQCRQVGGLLESIDDGWKTALGI